MSLFPADVTASGDGIAAPGFPKAEPRRGSYPGPAARIAGGGILVLAALAALSLVTWSSADPSLTHLSTAKPTNALGTFGAIFSDLALTALGLAAVLALLPPLYWGLQLVSGTSIGRFKLRAMAAPVAVLAFAAFFSALPKLSTWPLPANYGGLLGDVLHAAVTGAASLVAGDRAGLLAAFLSLGTALGLMTVSLGVTRQELAAMARFATRSFEPDSSWVAGLKQNGAAPLAAVTPPDLARAGFTPPPLSLTPEHQSDWTSHHGAHERGYSTGPAISATAFTPAYAGAVPPLAEPAPAPSIDLMQAYGLPVASPVPTHPSAPAPVTPVTAPADHSVMTNATPAATEPPSVPTLTYALPPTSLLSASSTQRATPVEMSIAEKLRSDRLRDVLAAFAVPGTVTSHLTGPVVTTFVFEPQSGTKTARVLGLADDIARALDVAAVRLQLGAGRGALVVEVPHDDAIAIGARDLVECEAFHDAARRLPLAVGATAQGEPVVLDLAALPSLLIAGRHADERAGALRALVASLAYRHTPRSLSLAIADADGSLGALAALPHCDGHAPSSTVEDAIALLSWAASEIDARTLRLRSAAQARTIEAYNARLETVGPDAAPMPYLVVVVADIAPLALADAPAFEYALHRIVREGAAVGVHLVAATSRTDAQALPEAISGAFTTRIAMKLASRSDSRAILADTGAEDLLGQGDALAVTSHDLVRRTFGGGMLSRLHMTRVSLDEAHAITAACQPGPATVADSPASSSAVHTPIKSALPTWRPASSQIDDALYGRAIALVRRVAAIDAGMFRRGLGVSYAEALALLDRLTLDRMIGPENADGSHEVLIGRAA